MKLFISYAHIDQTWVKQLHKALQDDSHHSVWMDEKLEAGDKWWSRILDEIEACDCLIFVQTISSVHSEFCKAEVKYALDINKPIIPLKLKASDYPPLRDFQVLDVGSEDNLSKILLRIEKGLGDINVSKFPVKSVPRPPLPVRNGGTWRDLPIIDFPIRQDRLVCISKNVSLAHAYHILDDANFRFRHLVVTESGRAGSPVLGIVSLRDMLKRLYGINRQSPDSIRVEDIMTHYTNVSQLEPTFITILQNDSLETVIRKFLIRVTRGPAVARFYYMSAIPVVDDNNNAMSIVSYKDMLNLVNRSVIPLSHSTIEKYYSPTAKLVTMRGEKTPQDARWELGKIGQRDLPIVNDDGELLGLVPDHILLENLDTRKTLGEIMVAVNLLKLQTLTTSLSKMLEEYLPNNISATYYSFAVVDDRKKRQPELLGMIGYRELFHAILESD